MFYLTMNSTHFIYGYGIRHMINDHSDIAREEIAATISWAMLSD